MNYKLTPGFQKGFGLVELLVVGAIIAGLSTTVTLTIRGDNISGNARDDVRKSDVNAIADAYVREAIDNNAYKPLNGRIPSPPEGGTYQGILTQDSENYKVCAVLEKGKDINCLENSDNPKCYCRSSHTDNGSGNGGYNNGGGNQSPSPSPSPSPSGSAACSAPKPNGLTTNYPGGSTNSIVGTDGTWCRDLNAGAGNDTMIVKSSCEDSCGTHEDYCQNTTTNRDWYCTGTWNGSGWKNVKCEAGGYVCNNGMSCSEGACKAAASPTPTPLPQIVPGYANDESKFFQTYAVYFFDYPGFPPPGGGWSTHISLNPDFSGDSTQTYRNFGIPSHYSQDAPLNVSYSALRAITKKYVGFASVVTGIPVYSSANCGKTLYWRIANYYNPSATDKKEGPTYTAKFDCTTKVGMVDPPFSWYTVYDQLNGKQKQYDASWDFDKSGAIDWTDYWLGAFSTKTRAGGWQPPE